MPSAASLNFMTTPGATSRHRLFVLRLHRAPIPEEEPLPGEEPTPEDEELPPHPDPSVEQCETAPS